MIVGDFRERSVPKYVLVYHAELAVQSYAFESSGFLFFDLAHQFLNFLVVEVLKCRIG